MLRIVVDTNIWIRALLGGTLSLPVLTAWQQGQFQVIVSEELLAELDDVWQRPRLQKHVEAQDAQDLLEQLRQRGMMVKIETIPPNCRDPKDNPVLATAIDGQAEAIVTGDADLRADEELRNNGLVWRATVGNRDLAGTNCRKERTQVMRQNRQPKLAVFFAARRGAVESA